MCGRAASVLRRDDVVGDEVGHRSAKRVRRDALETRLVGDGLAEGLTHVGGPREGVAVGCEQGFIGTREAGCGSAFDEQVRDSRRKDERPDLAVPGPLLTVVLVDAPTSGSIMVPEMVMVLMAESRSVSWLVTARASPMRAPVPRTRLQKSWRPRVGARKPGGGGCWGGPPREAVARCARRVPRAPCFTRCSLDVVERVESHGAVADGEVEHGVKHRARVDSRQLNRNSGIGIARTVLGVIERGRECGQTAWVFAACGRRPRDNKALVMIRSSVRFRRAGAQRVFGYPDRFGERSRSRTSRPSLRSSSAT